MISTLTRKAVPEMDGSPDQPNQLVTLACISDTHGRHRDVFVPEADILVHAGDFTHFGKISDAKDFNKWLGDLPHKHKIVVNGNHEHNAEWKTVASEVQCVITVTSSMNWSAHFPLIDILWGVCYRCSATPLFSLTSP